LLFLLVAKIVVHTSHLVGVRTIIIEFKVGLICGGGHENTQKAWMNQKGEKEVFTLSALKTDPESNGVFSTGI